MPALAPMTIADLARAAGVDIESIRSCGERGFIEKLQAEPDGESPCRENAVETLAFIPRALGPGFSLDAAGERLELGKHPLPRGGRQLGDIRRRIADLSNLDRLLAPLAMVGPRSGGTDDRLVLTALQQPI